MSDHNIFNLVVGLFQAEDAEHDVLPNVTKVIFMTSPNVTKMMHDDNPLEAVVNCCRHPGPSERLEPH
jgi:hypothetical protein